MNETHGKAPSIAALMLAAGQSKRFNGIKQLADVNGKPMLHHTLDNLTSNGTLLEKLTELNVVLGANAADIVSVVPAYATSHIFNHWQKGMGATLAFGVQKVNRESSHLLVTLADQVALTREHIATMLHHCIASPEKIIAARYKGVLGAPVVFPRRYFAQLMALNADAGARKILQQHQYDVLAIDMADAQHDIDTQIDLARWQETLANNSAH
ncbi:nucleotidyltransferase family protein [Paraglaciecola sp. T6c]|uniref:nucleotidyltransferase family protein n=1 Tax=Pseudoalteromonas atlantica (strain T6c / ATCC BAA-1087) TaxID=3042615 RepID=UPI0002F0AFDF|nr:nucleotidyltransferase family protein [Paraglaciecola sp. T6c]